MGISVYGVHADPRSPSARSRYWKRNAYWNFAGHPAEMSVEGLLRLSDEIGSQPILLPTDDDSCLFVADHAEKLREGFLFPDQPPGLTRLLSSKETMDGLCGRHSIPVPVTFFPRSRDDVLGYLKTASFPVMLKGIDTVALLHHAGSRMAVVQDHASLLKLYDEWETPQARNLMIQEYIPGPPEALWMFNGYFDDHSECLLGMTGRKIRQYPDRGGVTSLGVCVANEAVSALACDFMRALSYRGILDLDFKYDARDGQYKLLDVNPRIGTTFRLFVDKNGTDVVRVLYRDLTGQPAARVQPGEGRKWLAENLDFISSAGRLWNGTLGFADWLGSFRGVEEFQWLAADDLRPFLSMAVHSLRWLFRRNEYHLRTPALTNLPPRRSHVRNSLCSGIASPTKQQTNGPSGQERIRQ